MGLAREIAAGVRERFGSRSRPSPCSRRGVTFRAELRLALLAERAGALGEVLGARAALLQRDLELERGGERGARRGVDHALGEPDRDRRARQQLVDQLLRGRLELVGRRDAVGEPDPLGLRRRRSACRS